MDIIEQNPYRILGVLSNSSTKEILANRNEIKAKSKVGKTISFENDFSSILKPVIRNEETLVKAYDTILSPKDRVSTGFFWFVLSNNTDEIAISHLRKGQIEEAMNILMKNATMSSYINLAIINIIRKKWTAALYYYINLLNDNEKRIDFLSALNVNPDSFSETEVKHLFVDKILASFPDIPLMEYLNQTEVLLFDKLHNINDFFKSSNVYEYFSKKSAELAISRLDVCISLAIESEGNNAQKNLTAAKKLEKDAKIELRALRASLGKDSEYKAYCDKVANQIVDNCINYYNHDKNNPLRSKNILHLLNYALQIAVGQIVKDRCRDNYYQIKSEYEELVPEEIKREITYINKQIEDFYKLNSISNYSGYLDATLGVCYQKLQLIKTNVGENNIYYIKTSCAIISFAVDVIMKEVYKELKNYNDAPKYNNTTELWYLRDKLKWGKTIFDILKTLTKNPDIERKFTDTLVSFCEIFKQFHADIQKENLTIKTLVPATVIAGQQFNIIFKINSVEEILFTPPSFHGFKILQGPKKSRLLHETLYVYNVLIKDPGLYTITSASVDVCNQTATSPIKRIVVQGVKMARKENESPQKSPRVDINSTFTKEYSDKQTSKKTTKKELTIGCVFVFFLAIFILVIIILIKQINVTKGNIFEQDNKSSSISIIEDGETNIPSNDERTFFMMMNAIQKNV